jgi:hypothetical protein
MNLFAQDLENIISHDELTTSFGGAQDDLK